MKKSLFLFILACSTFYSFGQDSQLFENDWYLQKIIIDGDDHFPPNVVTEPVTGGIQFLEFEDEASIFFCGALNPMITYDSMESLFILEDDPLVLVGECIEPANLDYSVDYYSIFYDLQLAKNPFAYTIGTGSNGILILTIENMDGNQAVFGNELLSAPTHDISSFKVYPNPVGEELTIFSPNNEVLSVEIYDINGKKVDSFEGNIQGLDKINVTYLDSGIYFLKILTDVGYVTKKIIKK
ncbi:MAG: T9SS type A sorting domain-containing protein [Flavobacteriaceae bacterium]|nr:T9SS type A sorting domain-containing protein [Flavobacteriaceae bacterium]